MHLSKCFSTEAGVCFCSRQSSDGTFHLHLLPVQCSRCHGGRLRFPWEQHLM